MAVIDGTIEAPLENSPNNPHSRAVISKEACWLSAMTHGEAVKLLKRQIRDQPTETLMAAFSWTVLGTAAPQLGEGAVLGCCEKCIRVLSISTVGPRPPYMNHLSLWAVESPGLFHVSTAWTFALRLYPEHLICCSSAHLA